MIEMLGVLAIVGVLSAGGISGYSMAMQSYKTTQLIEKIQLISSRVRAMVKGNDYTGMYNGLLTASGKFSDDVFDNPFGGIINCYPSSDKNSLVINLGENIPVETCGEILQQNWGNDSIFWGINVGGTLFRPRNGNYPVETSVAISTCKGAEKHVELIFK